MLTRMAPLLTRMARMARLLTRMLTHMARMLTRMTRWLAYYTHSFLARSWSGDAVRLTIPPLIQHFLFNRRDFFQQ